MQNVCYYDPPTDLHAL